MAAGSMASAQQKSRASVTVEAGDPEGCLRTGAVRTAVERWLARSPRARELADLAVRVDAASEPVGFAIHRAGVLVAQRRFDVLPRRCEDRVDAVAVAIALALDHLARNEAGELGSEGEAGGDEAGAEGAGERAADSALPAADAQRPTAEAGAARDDEEPGADESDLGPSSTHVRVHAAGALLAEVLPEPAIAFGAGADWVLDGWQLAATLLATPSQGAQLGPGTTETQLVAAQLRACALAPADWIELEGCAGVGAGAAFAAGTGYADELDATMAWLAPGLRVALRLPRNSWLSVRLAFDGAINVVRPRLVLTGATQKSSAGPLATGAGLELSVALP